ncbi:DUF4199 domain-containing protein [Constantimarinum furrinae]|nr:DUF4199 domain-containing protein [Constantimarinum furrinae]
MKHIQIEFKWAIIFLVALLAWTLLERTLGWHDEEIANHFWLTLLFMPFAVLMYVLEMREKRRRYYNKKISWKQAFFSGALLSLFIALLSPGAQYVIHNFITPEYFKNVIDYSVTNKLMTIKAANETFNITSYMWQAAFGSLFGGLVISAIAAIFMRRS